MTVPIILASIIGGILIAISGWRAAYFPLFLSGAVFAFSGFVSAIIEIVRIFL